MKFLSNIEITGPKLEAVGATIVEFNDTLIAVGGSINYGNWDDLVKELHILSCPANHSK